jgi:hypothetical protein
MSWKKQQQLQAPTFPLSSNQQQQHQEVSVVDASRPAQGRRFC